MTTDDFTLLDSISSRRALAGAPSEADRAATVEQLAVQAVAAAEAEALEAARQERLRQEAAALLREAIGGVEVWARQAAAAAEAVRRKGEGEGADGGAGGGAGGGDGGGGDVGAAEGPDWELLGQRARLLGGEATSSLQDALTAVQRDFEAFQRLEQQGRLPTLLEELSDPLGEIGGGGGGGGERRGGAKALGAFQRQSSPVAQRQERQRRRQLETETKQLRVAAALGQRATKDSADAFVYGVLPPAKAVGRMVARRVAEALGNSLPGSGAKAAGGGGGVDVGLVGELAREIAQEYATDLQRGAQLGPLADLVEAVKGPTSKLAADMRSLGEAVGGAAERALASSLPSSAPPAATQATTPVSAVWAA